MTPSVAEMEHPAKILLVEDELVLADTLKLSLKKMGFDCLWAKTLKEARKLVQFSPSLLLLDRSLPDGDGLDLLKETPFQSLRVLILSSKSAPEERVRGLELGADDYLPKPFHWEELKARLNALLRRKTPLVTKQQAALWDRKDSSLQIMTHQGWIELTPLEYKFLVYLMKHEGSIISKDRLLKDVWGFNFLPKTRTVDYVLTQLRKRIELEPDAPKHLLTIRGAGVKFLK